ncbi:MAG TPA: polyphosphate kinase 1 [Desulfomonilia bacterium]
MKKEKKTKAVKKRAAPVKALKKVPIKAGADTFNDPGLYINRELSWLMFNSRVLEEALDQTQPLLERVKFLSIFGSNLDEFFMIRVSGLRDQLSSNSQERSIDGMLPGEQLQEIRKMLQPLLEKRDICWEEDLKPRLKDAGISVLSYQSLKKEEKDYLREYFKKEIYPVLTPLAFDPSHPFPHISSLSLNLAVIVNDSKKGDRFAWLKMPDIFPRFITIPDKKEGSQEFEPLAKQGRYCLVPLEEVVAANLDMLFPGLRVDASYPFRITRDADIEIEDDEASDLLTTVEEGLDMRHFGIAVKLEVNETMPARIRDILMKNLKVEPYLVYVTKSLMGTADLMQLTKINRPDLKDAGYIPSVPKIFSGNGDIFSRIKSRDIILYHPYESFNPVVDFIRQASKDPNVLAIKLTLYRTGVNSPIYDALMDARMEGKQVAALVELKARFDEETNIHWARALEKEGVHVVYGLIGMKVHAKLCLVVRREKNGIVRYVHMSTGNYNTITSRIYTDIGLFTCNPVIGEDVTDLFNSLTGYSAKSDFKSLLVAPGRMRKEVLLRIEREIERHMKKSDGYLAFKMNSLVDKKIIQALYRASEAGVRVDLQVRGICCLRPGIPGISENIRVTSVVGRFLEHARIFYFRNGGKDEMFLGSADMMPRNLDRRIEVLFPILDEKIKNTILNKILKVHLNDNVKSWLLMSDGSYSRVVHTEGQDEMNSQQWLLENRGSWNK